VGKRWIWIAWSRPAVSVASLVLGLVLGAANGTLQQDVTNQAMLLVGFSAFMVVGALIMIHRPGNAIGWIFSAIAMLAFTGQLASEYAVYAFVTHPGSLPGAILAAWYDSWVWFLVVVLTLVFTPLVVPNRSAALASLAAGRLAGRGGGGGSDRAECPPGQSDRGRG
jgi:hypothetical protein